MPFEVLTAKLSGYILEIDVFNNQGILLLQKGHVLSASDVNFLNMHNIFSVHAVPAQEKTEETPVQDDLTFTQEITPPPFQYRLHIEKAEESYTATIAQLKDTFMEAKEKEKVEISSINQAFETIFQLSIEQKNLFHSLAPVRDKENYLFQHSLHTGLIASTMASLISYSDDVCFEIGQAAVLHDIGKVILPSSILAKKDEGHLSEEEVQEWEQHPRYGYELLRKSEGRNNLILEGCLYHHERLNGEGYPSGLTENKIPLVAQIIAAANMYDNLCSHHSEHQRLSPYIASQELMRAAYNRVLNPKVVNTFVSFISSSYTGDYVLLSNGQQGRIIHMHTHEPHRPTVQLDSGKFINLQIEREITIEEFLRMKSS